jgi:hypothetical protein
MSWLDKAPQFHGQKRKNLRGVRGKFRGVLQIAGLTLAGFVGRSFSGERGISFNFHSIFSVRQRRVIVGKPSQWGKGSTTSPLPDRTPYNEDGSSKDRGKICRSLEKPSA